MICGNSAGEGNLLKVTLIGGTNAWPIHTIDHLSFTVVILGESINNLRLMFWSAVGVIISEVRGTNYIKKKKNKFNRQLVSCASNAVNPI